ncbi:hypothetical protein HMPREF1624_01633 [Sporothrix schenckii ATCC 58251]|uniref:Alpha/beta hydrolase fold-3 domain-containing protein n=1 Tax=Sporothrix schenckii (strain ATCC 58251 / de Perez 2211183) TaxID=1391915 RepID=U7Q7W6_SPOS1|nr:hypothetical protein HMPREF1624_01633 [Sporothrix schenckii ATCC 58251]
MAIVSRAAPGEPLATASATKDKPLTCAPPPLAKKIEFAIHMYSLQAVLSVPLWVRSWREYFYPPTGGPDIVKAYECRPALPTRIFFPADYDQGKTHTPLPTVLTIHGGGFCIGVNRDDDEYNRALADTQKVLVISLNYSKSPAVPFPTALHDLEALYHAVVADESLPLARAGGPPHAPSKSKIAVLGFSAGGNLALALPQLPSIRDTPNAPSAAVSVYGCLDLSRDPAAKLRNRFYKPALPLPQGSRIDSLASLAPVFDWSYIPYGHDLTDPLLSPAYASLSDLPPHVYLVAAELDMLAHESWRLACRLGNEARRLQQKPTAGDREVPDPDSKVDRVKCVGKRASSKRKGALEPADGGDDRYGWAETWAGGSVNWLLVPDAIHGFDNFNIRQVMGGEESMLDAEMKTKAYVERIGAWLHNVVWK